MSLDNVTGEQIYNATAEVLDEVLNRLGTLPEGPVVGTPKELLAARNWVDELSQHPEEYVADPIGTYNSCLKKL